MHRAVPASKYPLPQGAEGQCVEKPIVGAGAFDSPIIKVTDSLKNQKITRFYRRGVEGAAPYILKYRLF